jgi:hypothetical protein
MDRFVAKYGKTKVQATTAMYAKLESLGRRQHLSN